jgi:radical SAM protein with 4Fe4S-binding SPASM domain
MNPLRRPIDTVRDYLRRTVHRPEPAPPPGPVIFDPFHHAPMVLFLSMSTSNVCNFRCKHCHIWMNEDARNTLTTAQRVEVVAQFAALAGQGTVILAGGEVTMDLAELFAIAGTCRERGLRCWITTNGSHVVSPEIAGEIAASGITSVTVSLDGHRHELHEYTRGVRGCFDQTVGAIRLLLEARTRLNAPMRVAASCVVFDRNVEELDEYIEFCRGLGVDHVDLQLLSRTFSNRSPGRDVFFEKHFWWTPEARQHAKTRVESTVRRWAGTPGVLAKGPDDLPWMLSYIDDPDFRMSVPVCGSHERNLVVDTTGEVSLCFNAAQIFEEPSIGNVRTSTLAELWRGSRAAAYRVAMNECLLNCGALNCHRRSEAATWTPTAVTSSQ